MKIKDFKKEMTVDGKYLVKSFEYKDMKTGGQFLEVRISDQTGTITCRDFNPKKRVDIKSGSVVDIIGIVADFKGMLYVKLNSIELSSDQSVDDLVESAPISRKEIEKELNEYLKEIEDPIYSSIISYMFKTYGLTFMDHSAAKTNHHNYTNGLAYHTLSILRLAKQVLRLYPKHLHKDLLYSGIIMHDFGKTKELMTAPTFEYTDEGELLGHISIGEQFILEACSRLDIDPDDEKIVLLRHMVLSHHGLRKYGSPVEPKLLEAEVLHRLDGMDAMMFEVGHALDNTKENEFTDKIYAIDNRKFYKF